MKFTIGGFHGKPVPRAFNPIFFLFMAFALITSAAVMLFSIAMMLAGALALVVLTPFSFFFKVRQTE